MVNYDKKIVTLQTTILIRCKLVKVQVKITTNNER